MSKKRIERSRGKTSDVTLDPAKGIAIKQFRGFNDPEKDARSIKNRHSHRHSFQRELQSLIRLSGYENFPKLLEYDEDALWIKMSYCGNPYPCMSPRKPRPDLIDQANHIVDTLAKVDIKYNYKQVSVIDGKPYIHLQAGNLNLHGNQLYLLDFEFALPVGCEDMFSVDFVDRYKKGYTKQEFKKLFHDFLVPTGEKANDICYNALGNKTHLKIIKR